jgi:hypothetical protein
MPILYKLLMLMNSRRKGAKNERVIAKVLAKWTGKEFAKTPASGGLQWKAAMSKGDVVCTTEGHYFPFCIEGKFYVKIDFNHLLLPQDSDIMAWWKQCRRDAEKCNKVPMLLMRYNGMPSEFWFLVLETEFYTRLNMFDRNAHIRTSLFAWKKDLNLKFVILKSTEFFNLDYIKVKKIARTYAKEKAKTKKG